MEVLEDHRSGKSESIEIERTPEIEKNHTLKYNTVVLSIYINLKNNNTVSIA